MLSGVTHQWCVAHMMSLNNSDFEMDKIESITLSMTKEENLSSGTNRFLKPVDALFLQPITMVPRHYAKALKCD